MQAAKKGIAPQTVRPTAAADSLIGYGPSDLQSAYGLAATAGRTDAGRPSFTGPGPARTGTPLHSEGMRNSNSGRSHGTAGGFASAVPVRTAPTRW